MKTESFKTFEALSSDSAPAVSSKVGRIDADVVRIHVQNAHVERASALGAFVGSAARALIGGVAGVFGALRRKIEEVRNVDALNAMDDRMLKDLGIERSQIPGLVRSSASGMTPNRSAPDLLRAANSAGISNAA